MKVTDPSVPPASDRSVNVDETERTADEESDKPSAFSQVLAKKRDPDENAAEGKGGKRGENPLDPAAAGILPLPTISDPSLQAAPLESKHAVSLPPDLQQLVREISVVTNAAGNQQVHIELNSNVLKGLHIRIEKQEGAVAIQFQSSSDEVSTLLLRNADALSQSLADRGVNVADIRVTGTREAIRVQDNKSRSTPSRWQGQGRGQGGGSKR